MRRIYFVVREVKTEQLRISPAVAGYRPPPSDSEYTWGGPFRSKRAAELAVEQKSETLRRQLQMAITISLKGMGMSCWFLSSTNQMICASFGGSDLPLLNRRWNTLKKCKGARS